jgi:hypothetical protein
MITRLGVRSSIVLSGDSFRAAVTCSLSFASAVSSGLLHAALTLSSAQSRGSNAALSAVFVAFSVMSHCPLTGASCV